MFTYVGRDRGELGNRGLAHQLSQKMEQTPAYVAGRTIGLLGRTNPVGLGILGIGSVIAGSELIRENQLPPPDSGLRGVKPKRLFSDIQDPSEAPMYGSTKRIKHAARQPRQRPGEAHTQVIEGNVQRPGALYIARLDLPPKESDAIPDEEHPRNTIS